VLSSTLEAIRDLVAAGEVRISEHGYDELSEDGIRIRDVLAGLSSAIVVEDYPTFGKGPAVLALQSDLEGRPLHIVWGIPKGRPGPAVLITAYRPDPARWTDGFTRRRR
jgi:Domain of unknown function (DUF4258)